MSQRLTGLAKSPRTLRSARRKKCLFERERYRQRENTRECEERLWCVLEVSDPRNHQRVHSTIDKNLEEKNIAFSHFSPKTAPNLNRVCLIHRIKNVQKIADERKLANRGAAKPYYGNSPSGPIVPDPLASPFSPVKASEMRLAK